MEEMNARSNSPRVKDTKKENSMIHGKKSHSSEVSSASMTSKWSMEPPITIKKNNLTEISCASAISTSSMEQLIKFKEENRQTELRNKKSENAFMVSLANTKVIASMKQTGILDNLQVVEKSEFMYQEKLKSRLKEKFKRISEGTAQHEQCTLLNEIYTELYITQGWSGKVTSVHEVGQIEAATRIPANEERAIKCNDLFKDKSIRTVLTKGVAGIGKTISVQKFILDWAENKANPDIFYVFPLQFRELNLLQQKRLSLMDLIHYILPEMKQEQLFSWNTRKVLFIFDGLDECRFPLNFQNSENLSDVTASVAVDLLITNLIRGKLLPSALIWMTSRPGAAYLIPRECINQLTEIRGFNESQKEQYFRRKVQNESIAGKILHHMKSSRSLSIMCHIPVFCWILACVLERMFSEAASEEIPKTLTQMFLHFLIFQFIHKARKYDRCKPCQTPEILLALGKLAFHQLDKCNLIFYEQDLIECGLDVTEVLVYSGVCTQIFREDFGLHLEKVFSFVHLSIQEFLAALYAFVSFTNKMATDTTTDLSRLLDKSDMPCFLKSAVNKAVQSETRHLDLFLRFLLGLSLESNQALLQCLFPQLCATVHNKQDIAEHIKMKIRENPSPETSINLFHCLNELNDPSLVQEIQTYLKNREYNCITGAGLSPAQWSALVFVLLNSEEALNKFDLGKYDPTEECLLRLLPVVHESRKVMLDSCDLTEKSCRALSSVFSSNTSNLRDLHLNNNNLQDVGVKMLSAGLENPQCKLKTLRLCCCNLTEKSCSVLSSVFSTHSNLKKLELCNNKLLDSGIKQLCEGLKHPHCKLEILWLRECHLTENSCAHLSYVLSSVSSCLKELDLSVNKLQDSGVKLLSTGLENPLCKLEVLRVYRCNLTEESCGVFSAVLGKNSSLKHLNLNNNELRDSGVKLLSDRLKSPHCNLKILGLSGCGLTEKSCTALASALRSNPLSCLKELNLNDNNLRESEKELINDLLRNLCKNV